MITMTPPRRTSRTAARLSTRRSRRRSRKARDFHQNAAPQNANPIADRIHLAQLVGAQKNGLAAVLGLGEALAKRLLHQGVETDGWLIEHRQRRPSRESGD